jgi:hypothetical protein
MTLTPRRQPRPAIKLLPSYEALRKQGANRSAARDDSPLKEKTVNSGTVTEAQNAFRITKQIEMEQCGFTTTP